MPYKDAKKRKAQQRKWARDRRAGIDASTPGIDKPRRASTPVVDPSGARVIHWHDAEGQARVTNYMPPIEGWKGMGWCRDCNTKVAPKDNCCHVCFFGG